MISLTNTLENSLCNETHNSENIIETVEKSYFESAIEHSTNILYEYNEICKEFYNSINESSISDKLKVIKSFLSDIDKLVDKQCKYLDKDIINFTLSFRKAYISDTKLFSTLDLSKVNNNTIEKIKFTNLEKSIPKAKYVSKLFIDDIERINKLEESEAFEKEVLGVIKEFKNNLCNGFYDSYTAKIIGSKDPIFKEAYADILFNIFRNGNSKECIVVDEKMIKDTLNEFKSVSKYVKYLEDDIKAIKLEFKSIKLSQISKELNLSENAQKEYANYLRLKSRQFLKMIFIFNLALSARMDAISDFYMQSRNILKNFVKEEL